MAAGEGIQYGGCFVVPTQIQANSGKVYLTETRGVSNNISAV